MQEFTQRVIEVIISIPAGRVMTYGAVAAAAGNARAARQVARVLHSMGESHGLPWHRVVNATGSVSLRGEGGELQRGLLAAEGVECGLNGRIDLAQHHYEWSR